jgi:hypothetical protein
MTTCPRCGQPVVEAIMRKSGVPVLLDPEPGARGNLHLIELGKQVEFVAPERRQPKHPDFVPPEQRYTSHMASCTNDRIEANT